ncbi:MAG TPA: RNA 2',3'-cyclic phosphodiesterase, partial [Blastocatellia bacterium]|nr:RNA 2',3'-cyclic phosphodiesterase [Blastocatellia bacterium]
VLWAGLAGEIEKTAELKRRLEEKLEPIGFEREEKEFQPHLTIGRMKSNRKTRELLALADLRPLPALSFTVSEIVLMRSELHPAGARYSTIARAALSLRES